MVLILNIRYPNDKSIKCYDLETNPIYSQGVSLPDPAPGPSSSSSAPTTDREEQLQQELDAEGVVVAGATESLICPITQSRMNNPVLNIKCGHSYDRSAILEHIRRSTQLAVKCPVAGCPAFVKQNVLKTNKKLADLLLQEP